MKDKEKQIFDKYGNYDFPTEIKQEGLNNATSQIEEMARTVCCFPNVMVFYKTCEKCNKESECKTYRNCKELYEQGYRKIPENSVVLSREEYNKKKKHLQNILELSSFQFENVVKENEKLKEQLKDKKLLTEENYNKLCHLAYFGYDDAYEKGSKETAGKLLNDLYSEATSNVSEIVELTTFQIEELAKQFGVEIKE